jgi:nucleoside-diphosphate-sugar epimerase
MKRRLGAPHAAGDGIEWVQGDALNASDVMSAALGCSVIVHAVNPAGYRGWAELVLPMIDHTIAAARACGATVVLPGTVYNYGPDALPVLTEVSAQHPTTRKGAIRVQLEARLAAAADKGDIRVIVVRAGDFFGPRCGNNWFTQGMVKPGRRVHVVQWPGRPGVGHQFAYLPDVARTMVELIERRAKLPAFATFHMAGHWDADGREFGQAIQRAVLRHGGAKPSVRPFPWWLLRLLSPFVTTFRELLEMQYLWEREVRMENRRLVQTLGYEPHTPLDAAIEATLVGIGCLDVSKQHGGHGTASDRQAREASPTPG